MVREQSIGERSGRIVLLASFCWDRGKIHLCRSFWWCQHAEMDLAAMFADVQQSVRPND